jgi:hypothetical protein
MKKLLRAELPHHNRHVRNKRSLCDEPELAESTLFILIFKVIAYCSATPHRNIYRVSHKRRIQNYFVKDSSRSGKHFKYRASGQHRSATNLGRIIRKQVFRKFIRV